MAGHTGIGQQGPAFYFSFFYKAGFQARAMAGMVMTEIIGLLPPAW
jgi:hypothetical protein